MSNRETTVGISLGNCSRGVNSTQSAYALSEGEVQWAQNVLLRNKGTKRSPGYIGPEVRPFVTNIRGLDIYQRYDGTETLIVVSNGKVYSVNTTTWALTELYDIGGNGEAWGVSFLDKYWLTNGTDVIKLEGSAAYKVGMSAPTGAASSLQAGGTLPDGAYGIYITHTRQVDGTIRLHSVGQALTSRTCGSGNNTIRVTFSDVSADDPQITHVTIWMTDAGGSTYYYYGEAAISAGSVDIASNANRNSLLDYNSQAAYNGRPPALSWLIAYDNRLVGGYENTVYWTVQASSINSYPVFDLEKWPSASGQNVNTYPFNIDGGFEINGDLYLNTPAGLIRQPNGDLNGRYERVESKLFFISMRTLRVYNGVAWGLTNDGFRFFDGVKFSPDLSKNIRRYIDAAYSGNADGFRPVGNIIRRSGIRTEYLLSWRDLRLTGAMNNITACLNLDEISIVGQDEAIAPWDFRTGGFGYLAVTQNNSAYYGQSTNGASTLFKERSSQDDDKWVYDQNGDFITQDTAKKALIRTRVVLGSISRLAKDLLVWSLMNATKTFLVRSIIPNAASTESEATWEDDDAFVLDVDQLDIDRLGGSHAEIRQHKVPYKFDGPGFYVEIEQEQNDTTFEFIDLAMQWVEEEGRWI